MADIRDLVEKWDGHTGNEVEKFLKQELGKRQESLRLGAGLGWDEGKLAVRYGKGLNFYSDGTFGVNVGRGLKIDSCQVVVDDSVMTEVGKIRGKQDRLSVSNGLKLANSVLKLRLSTSCSDTNTSGLWYDDHGGLMVAVGTGLGIDRKNDGRLYIRCGPGITCNTDNDLTISYGTGLDVIDGEVVLDEDIYYRLDNAEGGIGRCRDAITNLQTAVGGKQDKLTLATGLEWGKTNMIQVKMNAPLNYDEGGRLKLNYDETLTVSGNKLGVDLYGVMDSGGGLFIKNTGLAVNVGQGLKIESCQVVVDEAVMTEVGKIGGKQDRLSVSNGLKLANSILKLRLSTSCSDTNTSGLWYDDHGGLMVAVGTGLGIDRKNDGRLYIRCGPGITCNTDNDLTISYGSGLDVLDGKVVLHEDIYDRLDSAEGGIGRCRGAITNLQTSVGGKQDKLTLATGLEWGKTNMIQVKMNAPLNYDEGGRLKLNYDSTLTVSNNKLGVDLYGVMDSGGGLFIKNNGLAVNVGRGLKIDSCQVVVDYGTGMSENNNKIYVDTSKIAGIGIDLDSAYKTLTIGTKAAKELAGTGLAADGPKMKVKYGSGLTTNTCGGLIVDAANLTVGNANKLGGNGIGNFMTFENVDGSYVGANFNDSTLSKVAAEKFIEFWDGAGGWFNSVWGKVTANSGFVGNLTGTADTANGAYNMNIGFATQQDACVPDGFNTMRIFRVSGSNVTYTGGGDGWILAFKWAQGNYVTQIYIDVDPTHIMSIRHRRSDSTWTEWKRVAFTDQIITTVTNGLVISCDRVISLPNLTSTLAGNAVDGSKNGAQRVLNLSCGTIQIKLSTGLAIDDGGYLYVQDKYVTK